MAEAEVKDRPRLKGEKEMEIEAEQRAAPQVVVFDPDGRRSTAAAADIPDLIAAGWTTDRPQVRRGSRTVVKSLVASSEAPGTVQSLDATTATGDTGTRLDANPADPVHVTTANPGSTASSGTSAGTTGTGSGARGGGATGR